MRWVRFNLVGLMGFVLQTATLSFLVRWAGLHTSVAVAVAVFAALTHNFFWHEFFTWPGRPREGRVRRWVSFHLSTGIVSLVSNVGITTAIATITGLPVVASNAIAVAVVSLVNFCVNDRLVFRE